MPTRRIFISHSTKGPTGLGLLNAVADRLERDGYDVLLDRKNLVPGDDWYQKVSEWMMACSGAVLLLNKDAAASAYVQHEASVLSHRWRTQNGAFKLFVALVDPTVDAAARLTKSSLSQGALGATRLSQAHVWSCPAECLDDADALAEALVAATGFGPATFDLTPWEQMIGAVAECLADVRRDRLESAVEASQMDELRTFFRTLGDEDLAHAIAAWIVKECGADLGKVHDLATYLKLSLWPKREAFVRSLRAAESHWLGSDVSRCPIAAGITVKGVGGAAAINGKFVHVYTLECFLQRALGPYRSCAYIKCDKRALSEDDVADSIKSYCDPGLVDELTDDDVALQLGDRPAVCLLPGYPKAPRDDDLIRSLQVRFPYIVFVAWPGPALPVDGLPDTIPPVDPPVDLGREALRRAKWTELWRLFS